MVTDPFTDLPSRHDRRDPAGLPRGRFIDLPGRGTTWVRDIAGPEGAPTLVLLHGWTVTGGLNWFTSMNALSSAHRVIALDHRGHGRGIRTWRRFRLEDCADDVAALADWFQLDSFIPVGYSMGGPIAQLVWKRHPDRVDGLVLAATSRNFRGTPAERALFSAMTGLSLAARVTPPGVRQSVSSRVMARRLEDTSDIGAWAQTEVLRNDPRAIVEAGQAIGSFSSHDWIGGVDVPTAVIVTEQDAVVPPNRQRKLAGAIAGATMHPVAGNHSVCVMEPQKFVPALLEACESVATRVALRARTAV
jgi:3-oxoadipate enol-lactonase